MSNSAKKKLLEQELMELQEIKSCEAMGFTIQDYIECKEAQIEMLNSMIERGES